MIEISSRRDGHRRAGMRHTGTVLHDPAAFDKTQLAQLRADPQLVVREVEVADQEKVGDKPDRFKDMSWTETQEDVEKVTGTRPRSKAEAHELMEKHEAEAGRSSPTE